MGLTAAAVCMVVVSSSFAWIKLRSVKDIVISVIFVFQIHTLTANTKKKTVVSRVTLLSQFCLVKQVNKEIQMHFLVGGCLSQRSLLDF